MSDLWADLMAAAEKIRAVSAAHPEWEATVKTTSDGSRLTCKPEYRAAALAALGMTEDAPARRTAWQELNDEMEALGPVYETGDSP